MTTSIREFIGSNKKELIIVIILSILFNLCIHFRELANPYIVYPDVSIFYILHNFMDKSLLSIDPYIQHAWIMGNSLLILTMVSNPLLWITAILSKFFPLSSLLVLPSVVYNLISVSFIFGIGCRLKNKKSAIILVILFLFYTATMNSFFGGQIRGIGFILTCAIYYFLLKEKTSLKGIILCVFFTFIYYPIILPAMLLTVIFAFPHKINKKFVILFIVLIFIFLLPFNLYIKSNEIFRGIMDWKYILKMDAGLGKDFFQLLRNFFLNFLLNMHEHSRMYRYFTFILLIASILILIIKGKNCLLPSEKKFSSVSLIAFLILLPIHPGIASRQLIFSLPLVLLVFFWRQLISSLIGKRILIFSCIVILIVFIVFNKYTQDLQDFTKYERVYKYISSLPKDTLIAGHPVTLELIPLFTKRTVFFQRVWSQYGALYPKKIKDEFKNRQKELLKLLYVSDSSAILSFLKRYKITHFIIEDRYYSSQYLFSNIKWFELPEKEEVLKQLPKNTKDLIDKFLFLNIAHQAGRSFGKGVYIIESKQIVDILKN